MKFNPTRLSNQLRNSRKQSAQTPKQSRINYTNLIAILIAVLSLGYAVFSGKQQTLIIKKQTQLLDSITQINRANLLNSNYVNCPKLEVSGFNRSDFSWQIDNVEYIHFFVKNKGIRYASNFFIEYYCLWNIEYDSVCYWREKVSCTLNEGDSLYFESIHPITQPYSLVKIGLIWKDPITEIEFISTKRLYKSDDSGFKEFNDSEFMLKKDDYFHFVKTDSMDVLFNTFKKHQVFFEN